LYLDIGIWIKDPTDRYLNNLSFSKPKIPMIFLTKLNKYIAFK